jgi:transcriptional regulator with XRE-family HTH domain
MIEFRSLRRLGGLTQFEVASKARIGPAALSRIEAGLVSGSADQRRRLMAVLLPALRVRQREIGEVFLAAGKLGEEAGVTGQRPETTRSECHPR